MQDFSGRNQVSLAFHLINKQVCWALGLLGDDEDDARFSLGRK